MREVLKKFGRYILLDQIAQGGMAEIYRARLAVKDGAGRLIAIKRIQAGFGANKEFLQMFKSEIKVTMGLSHPNIVQLYDFGEEQSLPFIAMELVDGKNLRQFLGRFTEQKRNVPVEIAAYIIEQAASALHYAHSFKDKMTGEPLNIIHRDISPQNVLISYDGNVKVIDFGIAKATVNTDATRAGVIKGKPSYLSPEQISGEPLDGRCDIFALGAVLWEVLVGRKLFAGDNDLSVLKLIESVNTHLKLPSTLNPAVPKELDYIVLKSLAKQREKRFQSADEMQRALRKFLYSYMPDFDPTSLAFYAKDLFKEEIVEDRKSIQKLNDKVERLLIDGPSSAPSESSGHGTILTANEETTTTMEPIQKSTGAREAFDPNAIKNAHVQIELSRATKGKEAFSSKSPSSALPPPIKLHGTGVRTSATRRVHQTQASIKLPARTSNNRMLKFIVAASIATAVIGPMFGIRIPVVSDIWNSVFEAGVAQLELDGEHKNVVVTINGQERAKSLPAKIPDLPVGSPILVTAKGATGTFQQEVTLRKGEKKKLFVALIPDRAPASGDGSGAQPSGQPITLRVRVVPLDARVSINQQPVDVNTPIPLQLDTPFDLFVEKEGYKPLLKRRHVIRSSDLQGSNQADMDVNLDFERYGSLMVTTGIYRADLEIRDSYDRIWKYSGMSDGMTLPVGLYRVHVVVNVIGFEKTYDVQVVEGRKYPLRLEEHLKQAAAEALMKDGKKK